MAPSARLANKFILVANLIASDGGAAIAAGNGHVVRARLSDARHFWLTDLAPLPDYRDKAEKPLDQRLAKLEALGIVFHEKLGTQGERVQRIATLARELAPSVGADAHLAERAARLAKADLVTEMVGEFPELQGLMGHYYASAQKEEPSVAAAIEDHYRPQGPNDRFPSVPVSIAVALADKLDTLIGFWAINEKPTGSKDPFALRRAALGIIRIVLENGLRLKLPDVFGASVKAWTSGGNANVLAGIKAWAKPEDESNPSTKQIKRQPTDAYSASRNQKFLRRTAKDATTSSRRAPRSDRRCLPPFPGQDDLLMIVRRVEAARVGFSKPTTARTCSPAIAAPPTSCEPRKRRTAQPGASRARMTKARLSCRGKKRWRMRSAPASLGIRLAEHVAREDFEGAMRALARLRAPVDAFFVDVTVNADEPELRLNRLRLLNELREAVHTVADFSKIVPGEAAFWVR